MEISQTLPSPETFVFSIKDFSFQEKHYKWIVYLKNLKTTQSEYYLAALQKFVEHYPFNHTYWAQYAEIHLKFPKGKAQTVKIYQIALTKNPRCITLWNKYLSWLTQSISKSDPIYLKKQYQKATKVIGDHYKAAFLFIAFCEMEKDMMKKYQMFKRALVSPLQDGDQIVELFLQFIDSLSNEELRVINEQQHFVKNQSIQSLQSIRELCKAMIKKIYQPTKQHVAIRFQYQCKISIDQYEPYQDSIDNWKQYLSFVKNSGNNDFLPTIYERALINQCDNESLWEEYFLFLENQGNYNRALYLLRSHATFFKSLSKQLTYYWIQLEQRQDAEHARQLYLQLQKSQYHLQTFIRHIQFELRAKQFQNAKKIFETIFTVFSVNTQIISYILIEYAEFMVKYFRDLAFARKLLRQYFDGFPYNEYLFISYLQFFIKHVDYKEGTKQGKQICEQFSNVLLQGLKGAYETYSSLDNLDQYVKICKRAKNLFRKYVQSIYLLKGTEKKIKQMELMKKKQSLTNNKRSGGEIDYPQAVKYMKIN